MKQIKKILIALLAVITFTACETYGDYETEYSVIYPLCGEWVVNVYDASGQAIKEKVTCNTYNTSDNATDKMWIKMGAAANNYGILSKVNCNVAAKDFGGENIQNLVDSQDGATSASTVSVTNGKVTLNGYDTPTGHKADAIEFTMTNSKYPGETLTIKGFRKTGWAGEDY
ncbi:lipid-binding protein [Parabacteroides chinchillae]|uniref:Lipid-binding putative hydrolase n=1 Tax=Parabacteroides chinchillae TaxID=871327 RepID=A0A8G2BXG3_9BACT|nr:lipid-binding protein [Parabacteroides chinchillae]SEG04390.1 Lipid-binding putative hydrolase [Parabacteroides chinchillae]